MNQTILIYSPQTSCRLAYTAGVIFGKGSFKITQNEFDLENYEGPAINYSVHPLKGTMQILPDGLLYETGIKKFSPSFHVSADYKLFLNEEKDFFQNNILGFDIFSAVFYIVSRYEEYGNYIADEHGRFGGKNSGMYQFNVHTKPLVDIWRQKLYDTLKKQYPDFEIPPIYYNELATVDIDRLYLYKEKGLIKSVGGMVKDILSGKFKNVSKRLNVLLGKENDPHDNLSDIITHYKKQNIELKIFWLLGDKKKYDNNLSSAHSKQIITIQKTSEYAEIGIHPSYNSYNSIAQIMTEKQRLETLLGKPVSASRQHFLRMQLPQTYQQLLQCGISQDYTMGWHDIVGFRAGTAQAFNWYDIENETETDLQITPFVAMDVTLKNYMKLNIEQACIILTDLQNEIRKYGGVFCTIAHNESFSQWGDWEGWDIF